MSADIRLTATDADAREAVGDPSARAAGEISGALDHTLRELAERLPETSTLHVVRDPDGSHAAIVKDAHRLYPLGEAFRLTEAGAISARGADPSVSLATVAQFAVTVPVTPEFIEAVVQAALEAFWGRVAELMPAVETGDMAPGECDPLEDVARTTLGLWVTNNHPAFAGDEDRSSSAALLRSTGRGGEPPRTPRSTKAPSPDAARSPVPELGIPYARVDVDTGEVICPVCEERIVERYDETGESQTNNYAIHYAERHGPLRWGVDLPTDVIDALEQAGVVTISARRAYREARHRGLPHTDALDAAQDFSAAEADPGRG